MRTAILSLFAVTALVISVRPADAQPRRYSNYGGYSNTYVVPYYSSYYPNYSYSNNYYQNYSYPTYPYPYSPNGSLAPSTSYYGPSGRGGALHPSPMSPATMSPAPMSWGYGTYRSWSGRP